MLSRRHLLGVLGVASVQAAGLSPTNLTGLGHRRAHAGERGGVHWELKDITLGGDKRIGTRFTMLVPRKASKRLSVLVALHGLGETHDQRMGAHAWIERYGLGTAYDRLCQPPVTRVSSRARYWTDQRLKEVNAELQQRPFEGFAVVCPYTPNVYKAPMGRKATLDAYADWIVDRVLPRARQEANLSSDVARTYLDGCSLGGYVGIEVFLRKANHFGAWGSVQGALGAHRIANYANRLRDVIAQHGHRHIHLETSTADAFRKVNERFSRLLDDRGIEHRLRMPPGPHNQPFLRDSGTLEMLLWYDRLSSKRG